LADSDPRPESDLHPPTNRSIYWETQGTAGSHYTPYCRRHAGLAAERKQSRTPC
jgi:hypothetical protein